MMARPEDGCGGRACAAAGPFVVGERAWLAASNARGPDRAQRLIAGAQRVGEAPQRGEVAWPPWPVSAQPARARRGWPAPLRESPPPRWPPGRGRAEGSVDGGVRPARFRGALACRDL